ncbi:meckelin-like isoform X3 [Dendrobates tinctorius]|uniref:meckelin-like isoform X3 n=1 Tax=Dendrobates tinctorius TaxID=92724 RepID=UPI003CC948EB
MPSFHSSLSFGYNSLVAAFMERPRIMEPAVCVGVSTGPPRGDAMGVTLPLCQLRSLPGQPQRHRLPGPGQYGRHERLLQQQQSLRAVQRHQFIQCIPAPRDLQYGLSAGQHRAFHPVLPEERTDAVPIGEVRRPREFLGLGSYERRHIADVSVYAERLGCRLEIRNNLQPIGILGSRALRRFFLVDGISDRRVNLSSVPASVTVATSLTLRVYLPLSPPSSEPPVQLTVHYDKLSLQAATQVSFAVTYAQSQGTFKRDTDITIGVLGSLAALLAILETSTWLRRSGQQSIGIMVIIKFLAFLCGTLANTFFLVAYGIAIYWLIAFKGQTSVVTVTLPPSGGQVETDFIIYLSVAFSLKALELIHLLVSQLTYNIFLIDWEKPKDKTPSNVPGKSNVSFWRTILVANEWNEIQAHRKLSPLLQLFLVLLLLEVVGLKNIATKDLNLDLHPSTGGYQAPMSIILRFGMSASMWLAVGIVQVLFFIFIFERFFEDKIKQFVDLCSLSNVSVFILTHKCYGYYIHGRSVHGQADVSMEAMLDHLRKEEENLCPLRGLEPGSEVQTFEVLLSERVREQYEKIMQPLIEAPRGPKGGNEKNPVLQQRIKTYYTINRFLSCFLEHVYKDMDYLVKDKLFLESVLDVEFQQPIDKSILYADDRFHFSRTLFYSNELVLLLFDTLLFCVIDLGTQNFVLATIITFVVQTFVKILRSEIGKKNLSMQTMVEENFLI